MKKQNRKDKHLQETLRQMPEVRDHLDKDTLFRRISSKQRIKDASHKKKWFAFWPIMGSVIALGLLFVLAPLLLNGESMQRAGEDSADNASDRANRVEESSGNETDRPEMFDNEKERSTIDRYDKTQHPLVVRSSEKNRTVIHGAVADVQGQYVIPLSFTAPAEVNKNDYLNELGQYMQEKAWGTSHYMFGETSFQLDEANQQVKATFPENFLPTKQGSSGSYMLENLLASMFKPYQVNKVVFTEEVDLGKIGRVKQLPLRSGKVVYKIHKPEKGNRTFLIEVPVTDQTDFSAALDEMKNDEKAFHVSGSVPENTNLSVSDNGQQLLLSFRSNKNVPKNQELVTMIDAILMTAKRFGYEEVRFSHAGEEQAGPYDLTEPLNVPLGANPISRSF
ncbi:hypothetical protein GCM10008983_21770 [Lentibacillus halophilus]|uniref:Sigma-X negative effector n=1 Tax=Lentibacillus halophilus TaxID=295065 RepID=A0ABP3J6U8_9BACI